MLKVFLTFAAFIVLSFCFNFEAAFSQTSQAGILA
jgi:hypothetical protein